MHALLDFIESAYTNNNNSKAAASSSGSSILPLLLLFYVLLLLANQRKVKEQMIVSHVIVLWMMMIRASLSLSLSTCVLFVSLSSLAQLHTKPVIFVGLQRLQVDFEIERRMNNKNKQRGKKSENSIYQYT